MSRPRTTALVATGLAVLLGTTACGGDDDPSEDAAAALEAAASAAAAVLSAAPDALDDLTGEASAEPTEQSSEPADGEGGEDSDSPCVTDSDAPSGTSTISFTSDSAAGIASAISTGRSAAVQADGTLEPSEVEVGVGEVFAVRGPESGIIAIEVGCAGGQTIPPGMPGAWTIATPGTYELVNAVTGDVLGSVSVR